MLMHDQPDFLDLYLGKQELLTVDLSAYALPQERDQQLDMDNVMYPADDNAMMYINNLVGDHCSQDAEILEVVQTQESTPELVSEVPQFSTDNLVFQFPTTSSDLDNSSTNIYPNTEVTVEILDGDLTDSESTYTMQVPSTPFSPTTPNSLPPATPDTASSIDSSCSGNMPSFTQLDCVKYSLKHAIKSKRQREGKGDLTVEFVAPPPEQLTEEEEAKRCEKREKNKLAAQKCREKKRRRIDELEAETKKLKQRQNQYKLEVQKLIDERDKLIDIINIHSQVCPHLRAQTGSI